MKDEQYMSLLQAVKGNHQSDQNKMLENVWKVVSTIGLALTFWIFTTTQQLDKRTAVMSTNQEKNTEELTRLNLKVDGFTEKPRFTQDDFNTQLGPVLSEISKINQELDSREKFMDDTENRFQSLELKISVLQNK
jgi:hypothetical protein